MASRVTSAGVALSPRPSEVVLEPIERFVSANEFRIVANAHNVSAVAVRHLSISIELYSKNDDLIASKTVVATSVSDKFGAGDAISARQPRQSSIRVFSAAMADHAPRVLSPPRLGCRTLVACTNEL